LRRNSSTAYDLKKKEFSLKNKTSMYRLCTL
jgi:hypothetical protein